MIYVSSKLNSKQIKWLGNSHGQELKFKLPAKRIKANSLNDKLEGTQGFLGIYLKYFGH